MPANHGPIGFQIVSRRLSISVGALGALIALDLVLVTACLLAVRRNLVLRQLLEVDASLLTPQIGSVAPPILGQSWSGGQQAVLYGRDLRPTAVYTFSKDCPHCEHNWRAMRALQALSPRRLHIVYVDTAEVLTPRYLKSSGIGGAVVFAHLAPVAALAYEARAVPQLEILDGNGRVQWARLGELNPSDITQALGMIENDRKQ